MSTQPRVLLLGAFDTKGEEYAYAHSRLLALGAQPVAVDFGVAAGERCLPVEVTPDEVAAAAGEDLAALREADDRGGAMSAMSRGAGVIAKRLLEEGRVNAALGMGGSGGSSVITGAMRELPFGVPKVCLSTVAGGDVAAYVGQKDITLVPSIADIAGLNRITRQGIDNAVAAVVGMASQPRSESQDDRPVVVASMFGNTTKCIDRCRSSIDAAGYEVLVFHATGSGGRAMEALIGEGLADASLDLTTTELADTLCGGVFDAGPERLIAASRCGVPQVVAPGCVDMVNYGPPDTAPARYRDAGRLFYEWNPSVTLMRTNPEENHTLGQMMADRLNDASGPVTLLVPLRGFSLLGNTGERFHDPESDEALIASLRDSIGPGVAYREVDANINDPEFADVATEELLKIVRNKPVAAC